MDAEYLREPKSWWHEKIKRITVLYDAEINKSRDIYHQQLVLILKVSVMNDVKGSLQES